jgi:hypothetical protein
MLNVGSLIQGLFFMFLVIPLVLSLGLMWKRNQNQKKAHGAILCVFKGIDKWWIRLLPVEGGQVKKPEGKYLKKSERGRIVAWPEAAYIAPLTTLPIMWPIGAMAILQVPVGLAIFKVGNPKPQPVDDEYPEVTSDTISAIHENKVVQDVFRNIPKDLSMMGAKGRKEKSGMLDLIVAGGVIIATILIFIVLTKLTSLEGTVNGLKTFLGG